MAKGCPRGLVRPCSTRAKPAECGDDGAHADRSTARIRLRQPQSSTIADVCIVDDPDSIVLAVALAGALSKSVSSPGARDDCFFSRCRLSGFGVRLLVIAGDVRRSAGKGSEGTVSASVKARK